MRSGWKPCQGRATGQLEYILLLPKCQGTVTLYAVSAVGHRAEVKPDPQTLMLSAALPCAHRAFLFENLQNFSIKI